jgi:hypothetical protein
MSNDTYEGTPAYEEGYDDACAVTDQLLGTLTEDVRNYQDAYRRLLDQYREHMALCVIRQRPRAPTPAAPVSGGAGR